MRRIKDIVKSFIKYLLPPQLVRQKLNRKGAGAILLTFDDGPHPEITPQVLDILDKYGAKSLFFIPGFRAEKEPKILQNIINRGHKIGNHTYSHHLNRRLTFKEYREEIFLCQKRLFDLTGELPKYFRPPQGIITFPMLLAAKRNNLKTIRWSIDTGEYSEMQEATPNEMAKQFRQRVTKRDIVLSHDDNMKTPLVLEEIIPVLKKMGFDLYKGLDCI